MIDTVTLNGSHDKRKFEPTERLASTHIHTSFDTSLGWRDALRMVQGAPPWLARSVNFSESYKLTTPRPIVVGELS